MASVMGLHLQYRLWIAELNADINTLRILNDYLSEITPGDSNSDAVQYYKEQLLALRNTIDALRHEMHINKMELGAMSKNPGLPAGTIEKNIQHDGIKERYKLFRKAFDTMKKDFQEFESKLAP